MFFLLSKTVGLILDPWRIGLLCLVAAGLLRLLRRLPRLRRGLAIAGVAVLWIFSTGLVSNALLGPLEEAHRRPDAPPDAVAAIVMLAGQTASDRDGGAWYELTESSDRFVETVRLARQHPDALVLLSGGSSAIAQEGAPREADVLARLAVELGLPRDRLLLDAASRNTHENAVESARLLADARGPVLLVTSAYHMPRAAACFAKAGLPVVPWPVDALRSDPGFGDAVPRPWSLNCSRIAIREHLGTLAYWVAGYL